MNRTIRYVVIGAIAIVVIVGGGFAAILLTFDPNKYKPDIEAAVERATGRTLALNGKISLQASLVPTMHVADVAFSNPPGFSRPQMATIGAVNLQVALLPLISGHVQIDRLTLIKPDILLETNAAGQPNWVMKPAAAAPQTPAPQTPTPPTGEPAKKGPARVSIDTLTIQDGKIGWRDDRTGKVVSVAVKTLNGHAASPTDPLHVTMDAIYAGKTVNAVADTGSLAALQAPTGGPWPVKLTVSTLGAKVSADGTIGLADRTYDIAVSGAIPDLSAFAVFMPAAHLPPVHDISFNTKVSGTAGKMPAVSVLNAHAGASNLGALTLTALDIKAPSADAPIQIKAAGTEGGAPFSLGGTVGALAALQPGGKPAPFPVDLTLTAAGASVAAKGAVTDLATKPSFNIGVDGHIPDLAALSGLAQRPLPPLRQVAFKATVSNPPGSAGNGVALKGISLTSPDADLAGNMSLLWSPRPALTANLTSNRIDLDALEAAEAATKQPAAPQGASQAAPQSPPPQQAAAAKHGTHLFPDTPIPFGVLRAADADAALAVGTLHAGGTDIKSLSVHAVLKAGKLAVDRLTADLPAGRMSGSATVDASKPAPPVHVHLHAPGLALKTLLAMANEPKMAAGNLEVYADLGGAGASPHAIAASLDGTLGLALANGTLDNRVMGSMLGRVLEAVNLLDLVGRGGTSDLRCFATHLRVTHGIALVDPLLLSSSLLTMSGSGSINLGAETLDLGLKPQVRAAATTIVVPLQITGPMHAPSISVNKLGAAESNIGTIAGAVAGGATPAGIVSGLLGVTTPQGGASSDMCPAALAAARGQPAPTQASTPARGAAANPKEKTPAAAPSLNNPAGLLKSLLQ